jgi:hypothetical protein
VTRQDVLVFMVSAFLFHNAYHSVFGDQKNERSGEVWRDKSIGKKRRIKRIPTGKRDFDGWQINWYGNPGLTI